MGKTKNRALRTNMIYCCKTAMTCLNFIIIIKLAIATVIGAIYG